ncbi:MAG: nucleoside-diphosphate kinase [Pelagibacteraceae bacterium TMED65]|nr:nucleoside-diphosphate kinase [Rickettsiales bacterium]OUU51401.1 MAG: nucleoside-diphosphate kinase [Pelagibacteraceae bacterium TMED65]|tara:strand:- start:5582 stop:5995 length:414 start_codon:yes stop_codon:yes gene_type:complete
MDLTLSIIKPDAVKRSLTGNINSLIEEKNIKIVAQKMLRLSIEDAQNFYNVHKERAFFDDLCNYMISGPIVVQVLRGKNVVVKYRELMGSTNPENADENTIRKLYGLSVEENSVHGSDSKENAKIEIDFFFSKREIF